MLHKISALIVDDEESARKLLYNLLKDLQCFSEIRMAKSAADADLQLAQYDPDLIFVDIRMPGRDGFSFINELPIKEIKPEIVFGNKKSCLRLPSQAGGQKRPQALCGKIH